ncbi:MAG TPA: hypothetical protein VG895_04645 [Patescibacteria group bacterium]|nr:hypothetical protein [Patescibacteria group bacterium]
MNFKIIRGKFAGNPDPSGWVYSADFTPISEELFNTKGRIFTVVSMNNSHPELGKEITTRLEEIYINSNSGDIFNHFKNSVEEILKTFSTPSDSLQIISAAVIGEKIILAGAGNIEGWVKRGESVSKLIDNPNEITAISGNILNGDEFFLGTASVFTKNTYELNDKTLQNSDCLISLKFESIKEESTTAPVQEDLPDIPVPKIAPIPKENIKKPISPVRLALAGIIDRILTILPFPNKEVYVKSDLNNPVSYKKRKIATGAGAILLLLLFISIIFGKKQQSKLSLQAQYQPILSSAQHDLDEAQSIASVNNGQARDLILQAKTQVDGLIAKNIKDPEISSLSNNINSALGQIAGIYEDTPNMYLDLTLLSSNFHGDDIAASDDRMVVLDKNKKILESIVIGTSQATPVAGPDVMPDANMVAAYSDRNFVTSSGGIWDIEVESATNIIPPDTSVGNNNLIYAYTGNLYLLDKNNSAVWRYAGDGGNFDAKTNWFGDGVKPDLSNVIAWTIDGNIWLLSSDGNILRFSGGNPIDFSLKNPDEPLKATDIFTTQDSNYLYILDPGNSRVLVVDKDGNYKGEYLNDNIKNATKLVVSETDKKIILLEGSKLYSLDVKNL